MAMQDFHRRDNIKKGAISVPRLLPAMLLLLLSQLLCLRAMSQPGSVRGTTLSGGEYLNVNDSLRSENGIYKAVMQGDGNFVIYRGNAPVWASNTVRGIGSY